MSDDPIAQLERLLAEDPGNVEARLRLADTLVARGRREEAIEAYFVAARVLGRRRDGRRAIQVCLSIMQLSPGHGPTQELVRRLCSTSLEAARTWREALGMASRRSAEAIPATSLPPSPVTASALSAPVAPAPVRHDASQEHSTVTVHMDDVVHRLDRSGEITETERAALLAATRLQASQEGRARYGDRHETPTLQMPALDRRETEAARRRIFPSEPAPEPAPAPTPRAGVGWPRRDGNDPRQMTFRGERPRVESAPAPPPTTPTARAIPAPAPVPAPPPVPAPAPEPPPTAARFAVPTPQRSRGAVPADANRTLDARRRLDELIARQTPAAPVAKAPEEEVRTSAGRVPREAMRSHTGAGADARDALERLRAARRSRDGDDGRLHATTTGRPPVEPRSAQRLSAPEAQAVPSSPRVAFSVPHPEPPTPAARQVFQPASRTLDVTSLPSSPLWDKLDSGAVRQLLEETSMLRVPARTALLDADHQPNRLLVVLRGEVELVVQRYGFEKSLGPCRPGAVLGASELLRGAFQQRLPIAQTEVDVLEVGARTLTALGRRDPTVWNLIWESHYDHLLRTILATDTVFESFRLDERDALRDRFRRRYARAGDVIHRRGDAASGLFIVLNGRIRVERGVSQATTYLDAGELFDAGVSARGAGHYEQLVAEENATVLVLLRAQIDALSEAHPEMLAAIWRLQ